jgi:hypothetical protein
MVQKHAQLSRLGILFIMIGLATFAGDKGAVFGQGIAPKVIYAGSDLRSMFWSPDSLKLALVPDSANPRTSASKSFLYQTQTGATTEVTGWGLQPQLTPVEKAAFSPAERNAVMSMMYASLDNNDIVYARSTANPSQSGTLSIGSRTTTTTIRSRLRSG